MNIEYHLYKLGINFWDSGTINNGRKIKGRYYKCDKISGENFEKIRKHFPFAYRGKVRSEFAPECTRSCIIIPSKAEIKRMKNK